MKYAIRAYARTVRRAVGGSLPASIKVAKSFLRGDRGVDFADACAAAGYTVHFSPWGRWQDTFITGPKGTGVVVGDGVSPV